METMTTLSIQPIAALLSRYKLWRSLPPDERPDVLKTDRDFAKYYGLSLSTLRQWESDPRFFEDVFATAKSTIGRRLPEILGALAARAAGGNIPAVKLALEVLGVHHDKIQHSIEFEDDRLVVIMPAGMAMPQHLQRSTEEPKRLNAGNREEYEIIDQETTVVVQSPTALPPNVVRVETEHEQYRPAKNPRGPRTNKPVPNSYYADNGIDPRIDEDE
jgi:hypothetical protein